MYGHDYTAEEILYLAAITPGRSYKEITRMFNERFGLSLSRSAISGTIQRCKLKNGRDGRFKPGQIPPNKGLRGISYPGMEATQFKPGNHPQTYKPVGTESERSDGYMWVKVADPKTWKMKHVAVWESVNGPVPEGHVVIFGDGNRQNFDPVNLVLVSRAELLMMNKFGLVGGSAELTMAGKTVANLRMKIAQSRKGRGGERMATNAADDPR